ncbi:TIGR00725 family protein [Nocardioides aestuarii]|uniref:TIGR00725 family protein n=1 Tax=Nocardioides aestuarii TaxID=252231 RepID=A0ABW4TKE4_9ACTN
MTGAYVAVVGPSGAPDAAVLAAAREVGRLLGDAGCVVVTGGGTGVMEAASAGAAAAGAVVVGLLPGADRSEANPHLTVAIATGLGEVRNALVVRAVDAVVAVGGSWGTLSEVALACRTGVPAVALLGWDLPASGGPEVAADPADAVRRALAGVRPA